MLSILHRYILGEISKYFLLVMVAVIGIYLAVDFFEKIDDFMENGVPLSRALWFFILKTPLIISQITPVGILLSVLITFGLMGKHNEIAATSASGISIFYLSKPIIGMGILASILLFFFTEIFVPFSAYKSNDIWLNEVRKDQIESSRANEKDIWLKGPRSISHIGHYNPHTKKLYRLTFNEFDEKFALKLRVDARMAFFRNGIWYLEEALFQSIGDGEKPADIQFFAEREYPLPYNPDELRQVVKTSEEMNIIELYRHIRKIEMEGYDARVYRVDFFAKFAFPLVCLVMSIMAAGISLRKITGDGIGVSIAYGIGISFLFWFVFSFCRSLGYGEILPPAAAAWTADIIFLSLGAYSLLMAE
ncbi:LPS export ABC transporter permease LptG [Desulfobacterales bacterium HSG17]|nr:LPS export ABC transporter permease LptG [Desulfobacterales bacterium HSG17]